ncbi:alpha/beta fold hydrolase [Paenibacillus sp. FA6]|uniref:alpha/beta fold hydrolase n=1 Tax=Paenibacillus sp. FA6 TaxID=3413029 RepID=UPI003F655DE6
MVTRFKSIEGKQWLYESYERLLSAWNVEYEEVDIHTRYGKTHIILAGKREHPPLVLFHGVGDNSALMWIYNVGELAKHFYIIAVDTIGGPGKSEPNEMYGKGFEQALWIDDLLNSLNISKVNIAGVSNGTYLANYYATKRPEKVIRMVCMAGGVRTSMMRMMLAFLPEALIPTEKNTKKLLKKLCAPNSDVFEKNSELLLHWNLLLKYFNNRSMMVHKVVKFTTDDMQILKTKALYLIGEYDILSNYPAAIKMLDDHELRYKVVADAGHGINHEQPETINKEMIRFLLDSDIDK